MNMILIRLTESDLHRIIRGSVVRYLNEIDGINDCLQHTIEGNNVIFTNGEGKEVGGLSYNPSHFDEIYSEYKDSVADFDSDVLRKFDYNTPVVNIEDVWVNRQFQGKGFFRKEVGIGIALLRQKYSQFILRTCSDNGFQEEKLVSIYQDFGFIPFQETDEDGTIMYLRIHQ